MLFFPSEFSLSDYFQESSTVSEKYFPIWLNLKDPAKKKENQAARRKHFQKCSNTDQTG